MTPRKPKPEDVVKAESYLPTQGDLNLRHPRLHEGTPRVVPRLAWEAAGRWCQ